MENYNRCILWIDFNKIAETIESEEDGQLWNQEGSLKLSDAVVVGNLGASEGLKSRANGVATSTSLVGRRVS